MRKNKTQKIWKNCKNVPCGEVMDNCKPEYCVDGVKTSKNWGHCNMYYMNPKNKYHKKKCMRERRRRSKKKRIMSKKKKVNGVEAEILHIRMPYIWRKLDNKTRKKMIRIAKSKLN